MTPLSNEELAHMKDNYNPIDLIDIQNVKFNHELSIKEMLEDYIEKVNNPYHFKSGSVEVEIIYSSTSKRNVSDLLKDYFLRKK